ncbi:MAG: FkbM family methyltransferase [Cyanobacteriota bacterium]|nr:FkbM family methyltransferase [Cyanobacteriota bacterium]
MDSTLSTHRFKESLNFLLARTPSWYAKILKSHKNCNFEKVAFLNLVQNNDIVVEAGANRGYYTLLFSHIVGKNGEVHGFEPVPPTFKQLSRHLARNQVFDNIHLNNLAVGDCTQKVNIHQPDDDDGQSSLVIHSHGSWANRKTLTRYECNMTKLDDYTRNHLPNKLDFIKCDIEGAELLFLKGATETLKRYHPMIYLEVCYQWTKDFDYEPKDIIEFLRPLGYSHFYWVDRQLQMLNNPERDLARDRLPESANLLCLMSKKHSSQIHRWGETSKFV